MQALAALQLLLGRDGDVGKLRTWNAMDMSWRSIAIRRDPKCPVCSA